MRTPHIRLVSVVMWPGLNVIVQCLPRTLRVSYVPVPLYYVVPDYLSVVYPTFDECLGSMDGVRIRKPVPEVPDERDTWEENQLSVQS